MISMNLRKRLITSIGLLFLLILIYNYSFITVFSLLLISILSIIEFMNLLTKVMKKNFYLLIFCLMFIIYIFLFSYLFFIFSNFNKLKILLFIILLGCIGSDIGGYIFGKIFKGPKLTKISPNKTYEGYIGALVLTTFTFIMVSHHFNFQWTSLDIILLLIFIIMVFFGDFLMSLIKRVFEIKDTGSLLPGHGGVLDRLDSYFTSLPIFYLWFMF
mgnify:CR=1 FL=1